MAMTLKESGATEISSVCVYCGSSFGNDDKYAAAATELGQLLHKLKWRLVYGGGTTGLMGAVAKAAMGPGRDGSVLGIIPNALVQRERHDEEEVNQRLKASIENHKGASPISLEYGETIIVPDMHTRKRRMANESSAFIAMPGGYGTFEEVMECITWSQLGIHNKPIVLFNIDGFYDSLLTFLQNAVQQGFISKANGEIVQVASTPSEVIDKIRNYKVPEGRFNLNWNVVGDHEHCSSTKI